MENDIVMVGVSHHTVGLTKLEQISRAVRQSDKLLESVLAAGFLEAMLLSTCGRLEIYATAGADPSSGTARTDRLRSIFVATAGVAAVGETCVSKLGGDAVAHLFRVSAGLDSQVVGETDIQDQVRAAGRTIQASYHSPSQLAPLVKSALTNARAVHRCTSVGGAGRSLASRAVERALELGGEPADRRILVIGSGTMARHVVQAAVKRNLNPVLLARDVEAAIRLTSQSAEVLPFASLESELKRTSLVVVATSSDQPLITAGKLSLAMGEQPERKLTIVDLAVPRNVEQLAGSIDGVFLLDVDGLRDMHPDPEMTEQIAAAEAQTHVAAMHYTRDLRARLAADLLQDMRTQVSSRCRMDLEKTTRGLMDEATVERAIRAMLGPAMRAPTLLLEAAVMAEDPHLLSLLTNTLRSVASNTPGRQLVGHPSARQRPNINVAASYRCEGKGSMHVDQSWPC